MNNIPSSKKDARLVGAKTYLTGKPCKRGHLAHRYTNNGHCLDCAKQHQKEYWAAVGIDKKRETWREWASLNRDHRNEYKRRKKWKQKDGTLRWAQKNPDGARGAYRRYYQKNKDKFRAKVRNRHALIMGAHGNHSLADVVALLSAQGSACAYCSRDIAGGYHVDHIVPLSRGGSNDAANIQLLCPKCNLSKGSKTHQEFIEWVGKGRGHACLVQF